MELGQIRLEGQMPGSCIIPSVHDQPEIHPLWKKRRIDVLTFHPLSTAARIG